MCSIKLIIFMQARLKIEDIMDASPATERVLPCRCVFTVSRENTNGGGGGGGGGGTIHDTSSRMYV